VTRIEVKLAVAELLLGLARPFDGEAAIVICLPVVGSFPLLEALAVEE